MYIVVVWVIHGARVNVYCSGMGNSWRHVLIVLGKCINRENY